MNLPKSRGRDMVAMALNIGLSEKISLLQQELHTKCLKHKKDDDPDFYPESSAEESDRDFDLESIIEIEREDLNLTEVEEAPKHSGNNDLVRTESGEIVKFILDEVLNSACNNFTKLGEKRKRKKYEKSAEDRKRLKTEEIIKKHALQSPCTEKCKRKCNQKITSERRAEINHQFWNMTSKERKTFMFTNTKKVLTKRNTRGNQNSRRKFTVNYFFKDAEGSLHEVCKVFFLTTLGNTGNTDRYLRTVLQNTTIESLQAIKDQRGRHTPINKINKAPIIDHINSFQPSISHYRREHAPNRKYLPNDLNIQMMHIDFSKNNPGLHCSYELYRKVIQELNICFVKLGHEECFSCEKFFLHEKNSLHKTDAIKADCNDCQVYDVHIKKAEASRRHYQEDGENVNDKSVYSADLQKVIMLPRYESLKEVIFTHRITAYNESFVPVGKKQKNKIPIAIIWHEGVAGRSKTDLISTFYSFFMYNRDEHHIVLWLDNCSSQNKNWALLAFFVFIVNSDDLNLTKLEIKYFEPGHTFMSADSFHHQVEMSLKKKRKVLDFSDFEDAVQKSNSGKPHVVNMKYNNFYNWGDFTSNYKLNKIKPRPYLNEMVYLEFTQGEFTMKYKTGFSEEPIDLNFLSASIMKNGFPQPPQRTQNRGISVDKKNTIIEKLGPVLPKNRIKFWEDLSVSAAAPLDEDDS